MPPTTSGDDTSHMHSSLIFPLFIGKRAFSGKARVCLMQASSRSGLLKRSYAQHMQGLSNILFIVFFISYLDNSLFRGSSREA
jgi:hypothetical protein